MQRLFGGLANRVGFVVLITLLASTLLLLAFRLNPDGSPWAQKWASVTWIGLVAGILAHFLLLDSTLILKTLTAFLSAAGALWLIAWLTPAIRGAGLYAYPSSFPNWDGLAQLAWVGLISFLFLFTLNNLSTRKRSQRIRSSNRKPVIKARKTSAKRPAGIRSSKTKAAPRPNKFRSAKRLRSRSTLIRRRVVRPRRRVSSQAESGVNSPEYWYARWEGIRSRIQTFGNDLAKMRWRDQFETTIRSSRERIQFRQPALKVKTRKSTVSDSPVRLSTDVEHRCPYCLEVVAPHDPRGIRECSICHTRHHADCWAVTGVCQVPHYHD